jgi:2-polyprenyl-3-methyl-5-hydroxy-6-metoxy-1,4-benzoquinol methylase
VDDNRDARDAWNANAAFWDERMGEGNDFLDELVWPATERLLAIRDGDRVLDIACGSGVSSRRLARAGARVTAFDFAEQMIERARARGGDIDYRVIDATDEQALTALGRFDAALCNLALMDMAEIAPLYAALSAVLAPGGRFVFSVLHPAFNNPWTVQTADLEDRDGLFVTTYAVKVPRYRTPGRRVGIAMPGQPRPHPYFHRSLEALLGPAFAAGLVLDGIEERSHAPENRGGSQPLSWNGNFSEIPPALVVRLRTQ